MTPPMLFPVSLNLQGKTCLVVGGGIIAEKRVRSLLACQALVRLVSPQTTPWLATAATRGLVQWEQSPFAPAHLHGVAIVFVATDDRQTNAWVGQLARQERCLVNVADDPEHCDFYMPAVVRRDHLSVAISTDGQAPALAAWLRKQFDRLLAKDLGQLVARYSGLRASMQERYPDMPARVEAWEQLLASESTPIFQSPTAESS